MKTIKIVFIFCFLALLSGNIYSQTDTSIMINPLPKTIHGQSYYASNLSPLLLGGETISNSGLTADLVYILNSRSDTSWKKNEQVPKENLKQYGYIENKYPFILGNDTFPAGKIAGRIVYLLNPPAEFSTTTSHNWTGTQNFSKIYVDTVVTNNIDSVTSLKGYDLNGNLYFHFDSRTADIFFTKAINVGNNIYAGDTAFINVAKIHNLIGNSPITIGDALLPQSTGVTIGTQANKFDSIFFKATDTIRAKKYYTNALALDDSLHFNNNYSRMWSSSNGTVIYIGTSTSKLTVQAGNGIIQLGDLNVFNYNTNVNSLVNTNPYTDYGYSLGDYKTRWDTINARRLLITTAISMGANTCNGITIYPSAISQCATGWDVTGDYDYLQFNPPSLGSYKQSIKLNLRDKDSSSVNIFLGGSSNTHFMKFKNSSGTYVGGIQPLGAGFSLKSPTENVSLQGGEVQIGLSTGTYMYRFHSSMFYPNETNTRDLGSSSNTWKNIYAGTRIYSPTATFSALPEYADNDAAKSGGLTAGMLFKTSTGVVMIVF